MKKITTIVTALMMLFSATTFAADSDNVPEKVKAAFVKDFTGISDVRWEQNGNLFCAYFTLNGNDIKAVYKEEGELNSASRTLGFNQLPLSIAMAIKHKYEGYTIAEKITEVTSDGITTYHLTAENAKQILMLAANNSGDIVVENKSKK